MIYYKGFDENLKCRGFQYKEGETYVHSGNISLCNNGFHFCSNLKHTFNYYPNNEKNRYAIVEPAEEAKILTGGDKLCTDKLKIVKVLSKDEVHNILENEQREYTDNRIYCLDIVKELQSKYNFMIGGSVSLYLMGYSLKREENKIDFDIIIPYYQKLSTLDFGNEVIREIEEFDGKSSGNDYSSTFALTTKDGRFLKLDVRISPHQKYDVVNYKGFNYKVCDLMTTLEAKCRYAMEGNSKHKNDILSILRKTEFKKEEPIVENKVDDLLW